MGFEIVDEELKRLIKRKAIKSGCDHDGGFVRYNGVLYYVVISEDLVIKQLEGKSSRYQHIVL